MALAAGLALLLGTGAWKAAMVKTSQHVPVEAMAPLVFQGGQPGNLSSVTAIKADGHSGIFTLSAVGPLWRLQHFNSQMALLDHVDLPRARMGTLSDLTALPDGGVCLAGLDGTLWRLDSGLRPLRRGFMVKTGGYAFQSIDLLPDGRFVAVDTSSGLLVFLDAQGKVLQGIPIPPDEYPHAVALVPEGLACMEFHGDSVWVRVIDLTGKTLRRFRVRELSMMDAERVAASGNVLIFNDAKGGEGVVFYSVQGKPLGNSLSTGSGDTISILRFPGFVAGDPAGGVAYVHFSDGLIKLSLPWSGKGPS